MDQPRKPTCKTGSKEVEALTPTTRLSSKGLSRVGEDEADMVEMWLVAFYVSVVMYRVDANRR
jgi:hypothetical protein